MMSRGFLQLALATLLATSSLAALPLGKYGASKDRVSVSGISAGGFMAVQVHVAYSASVMGVGVVAGGPYWCAKANLMTATTQCMSSGNINVDYLVNVATPYALATNSIDDPENMADDKVYVFGGMQDTVVVQDVARAADEYYRHYIPNADNFKTVYNIAAEHSMVVDKPELADNRIVNKCGVKGSPYINHCSYNAAYEMLNHIYGGGLEKPSLEVTDRGDLLAFDQTEFFNRGDAHQESVADTGYVYIPTGCQGGASDCSVHIALHGCLMQYEEIGDDYVKYSGYNEVADLNNIIIIYPQTIARQMIGNPNGCWDWWSYAAIPYATNLAPQMQFIKKMMDRVTEVQA